jgi:hypothetical protein
MFGMILQWDTVCFTTRPEKLQGWYSERADARYSWLMTGGFNMFQPSPIKYEGQLWSSSHFTAIKKTCVS